MNDTLRVHVKLLSSWSTTKTTVITQRASRTHRNLCTVVLAAPAAFSRRCGATQIQLGCNVSSANNGREITDARFQWRVFSPSVVGLSSRVFCRRAREFCRVCFAGGSGAYAVSALNSIFVSMCRCDVLLARVVWCASSCS